MVDSTHAGSTDESYSLASAVSSAEVSAVSSAAVSVFSSESTVPSSRAYSSEPSVSDPSTKVSYASVES